VELVKPEDHKAPLEIALSGWRCTVAIIFITLVAVFATFGAISLIHQLVAGADYATEGPRIVREWDSNGIHYFTDDTGRKGRFVKDKFK